MQALTQISDSWTEDNEVIPISIKPSALEQLHLIKPNMFWLIKDSKLNFWFNLTKTKQLCGEGWVSTVHNIYTYMKELEWKIIDFTFTS